MGLRITLSRHARQRMFKRGIVIEDVEYAILNPVVTMPGNNPNTTRIFADVSTGRSISVVYKYRSESEVFVITAAWREDDE